MRHAKAGSRRRFDGDDQLRPLSANGGRRPKALVELLAHATSRASSRARTRAASQTVEPLAQKLGLEVERRGELAEGADWSHALELIEKATAPARALHPRRRDRRPHAPPRPARRAARRRPDREGLHLGAAGRGRRGREGPLPPATCVTPDELLALLARGAEHADEEHVDLLAHSLQCAALLAERRPGRPRAPARGPRPRRRDDPAARRAGDARRDRRRGGRAAARAPGRVARVVARGREALPRDHGPHVPRRGSATASIVTLEAQGGLMDDDRASPRSARRPTSTRCSSCGGPTTTPRSPTASSPASTTGARSPVLGTLNGVSPVNVPRRVSGRRRRRGGRRSSRGRGCGGRTRAGPGRGRR